MAIRFILIMVLTVITTLSGAIFFLSEPDKEHPEYQWDSTAWVPSYHDQMKKILSDYGVEADWIKVTDQPGRLIKRPVYLITIPSDLPVSDLQVAMNEQLSSISKLRFEGYDNRRDKQVSLHAFDGRSVVATYFFEVSAKISRPASDIFLLVLPQPDEITIPDLISDKRILSTLLLPVNDIKSAQAKATELSKSAIDFGMYVQAGSGKLEINSSLPGSELLRRRNKLGIIFPAASLYFLVDGGVKTDPEKSPKFRNKMVLTSENTIKSLKDLDFVLANQKGKSKYQIYLAAQSLFAEDGLKTRVSELEKKGYRFRYFRDFNEKDYSDSKTVVKPAAKKALKTVPKKPVSKKVRK